MTVVNAAATAAVWTAFVLWLAHYVRTHVRDRSDR